MKKVIVTTRVVYHKIASVEVDIPSDLNNEQLLDWLQEKDEFIFDELFAKLPNAPIEFGFGLGDGMDEKSSESETRYDVVDVDGKLISGGHL